jgi:hypothetical protein
MTDYDVMREYARFEQAVIVPAIGPPPHPWLDIRVAMTRMERGSLRSRVVNRVAKTAGRIAAGGTLVGCLAFALVLWTRYEGRKDRETASAPVAAPTVAAPVAKLESRRVVVSPPHGPVDGAPTAVEPPVNTEVRVLAALHRLGADLGEPVEVEVRPDGKVVVGGAGLPPSRQSEIREALAAERGVAVQFTAAPAMEPGAAKTSTRIEATHSPLEAQLRAYAGGDAQYQTLSDRVLDESDTILAQAHALHGLAQRFSPERQAELRPAESALLKEMIAEHEAAFRDHARALVSELAPLAKALGAPAGSGAESGDAFAAAQRMDRVLSEVFGAARTDLTASGLLAELANASTALAAAAGEAR